MPSPKRRAKRFRPQLERSDAAIADMRRNAALLRERVRRVTGRLPHMTDNAFAAEMSWADAYRSAWLRQWREEHPA